MNFTEIADKLRERIGRSGPLLSENYATDFRAFARAAMRIVQPNRKIHWNWTYDYLCEVLMMVQRGAISRQIFNTPPRWLKSTMVSVLYPCWLWISDPRQQILCASCEMALATDFNGTRRRLLTSAWYQELF